MASHLRKNGNEQEKNAKCKLYRLKTERVRACVQLSALQKLTRATAHNFPVASIILCKGDALVCVRSAIAIDTLHTQTAGVSCTKTKQKYTLSACWCA